MILRSISLMWVKAAPEAMTNHRMRRARLFTAGGIYSGVAVGPVLGCLGYRYEATPLWLVLGTLGLVVFSAGLACAVYRAVTPWLTERAARLLVAAFAAATVVSIPTVGPLGAGQWQTWAFLAASVIGTVPLLFPLRVAAAVGLATVGVAALAAWSTGASSPLNAVGIAAGLGASIAAWNGLHLWLWTFLVQAQEGRDALTRLATTEERLRFARDVHDLLGHNLSVIALKAELASRLALADAERASQEADEVRALAASALAEMREVVHGYRRVDLRDQALAVAQVLRASGVRCTLTQPAEELPAALAGPLVPVLREASTNVMRHSSAEWCTIDITKEGAIARLTMVNDGAEGSAPDHYSGGLRGLAERLGDAGGSLQTWEKDGMFTLVAEVRS